MLFVVFKCADPRQQHSSKCPMILELSHEMLNQTVGCLKQKVHHFFRDYMSPFIDEHNIRLICKKGTEMVNEFPVYMYFDPRLYFQEVLCTVKPSKLQQSEQKWKYLRNSIVLTFDRTQDEVKVVPKMEIKRLDKLLTPNSKIVINSKQIVLESSADKSWSEVLTEGWNKLMRKNECLFVKVIE